MMICVLPVQAAEKNTISKKERNAYFSRSAFIGNSIGLGLKYYAQSQKKGYLGGPKWFVQGCYSFANDSNGPAQYRIHYKGKVYKAKDAIAASKVKRVFICMGTNDMWKDVNSVYKNYASYVNGIRKRNPEIVIYIESTPPMCSAKNRKYLNNKTIRALNRKMKQYCKQKKNVYYINIAKGMYDKSGGLKRSYSSDGYVHLNSSAYKLWMKNVTAYVNRQLYQEKLAE